MDERDLLLQPKPPQLSLKKEEEKKKEKQKKLEKKAKIREEHKEEVFVVIEENQNAKTFLNQLIQWLMKKTVSNKMNKRNESAPKMVAKPTINPNPNPVVASTPFNTRLTPQLKILKDKELAAKKALQEKEQARQNQLKKDLQTKINEHNKKSMPKPAPKPQALKPTVKPTNPLLNAAKERSKNSSYTKDNGNERMHVSRMELGG